MESIVYNEDCMIGMAKYPDKYFDLAVVDPPYGIMADINQNKLGGKKGFGKNAGSYKKYHTTNWDFNIPSNDYFIELQRVSKNQIIWGGNYFFDLHLSGIIIWNKLGSGNFKQGELAKTNINTFKIFDYSRADAYINDCDIKIHPTQKPVALYSWIFLTYLKEGGKVIDTHLGSGSNRIAADKANNIDFVGFELDKDYFEAQEKRWAEYKKQLLLW